MRFVEYYYETDLLGGETVAVFRSERRGSIGTLIIALIIGIIFGSIIGQLSQEVLPVLSRGSIIEIGPANLNVVNVLILTGGIRLNVTVASGLGIILSLALFYTFRRS